MDAPLVPATVNRSIWYGALVVGVGCVLALGAHAQVVDEDQLRKVDPPKSQGLISSIAPLSDGRSLLIGYTKGAPIVRVDTSTWTVTASYPLSGYPDGPRLSISQDGHYLHAFALPRFADGRQSDPVIDHTLIDLSTGRTLQTFQAKDASLSVDGSMLARTAPNGVELISTASGAVIRTLPITGLANAIALAPDASTIAVAHAPTVEQLGLVPSLRNDKKAIKGALKFRQMVSFYNTSTGALIATVPEVYDIIRSITYAADGTHLLIHNTNDPRAPGSTAIASPFGINAVALAGRIELVDAIEQAPLRTSFWTRMSNPVLAVDPSGTRLALSGTEGRNKRKVTIHGLHDGGTQLMIDLEQKHRYDVAEDETHDGRTVHAWMPDGRLVIALGQSLGFYAPVP